MADPAACRLCGNPTRPGLQAREMMFGSREPFAYGECTSCGCVQIAAYPADMARHYPPDYYAFEPDAHGPASTAPRTLKRSLKDAVFQYVPGAWRAWMRSKATQDWLAAHPVVAIYAKRLPRSARILDVGCGSGALLKLLREVGYRNAEGADPFIEADIRHDGSLLVSKRRIDDVAGPYDCVSMHHALEHMPDQKQVWAQAARLLKPGGLLIVRVPVAGTMAWREYRTDWVQLDAPRHFYLHTVRSLEMLAHEAGFRTGSVDYDSTGFQLWGSELYRRDIPLLDPRSPVKHGAQFSAAELASFERRAAELNAARDGDQIAAVFMRG